MFTMNQTHVDTPQSHRHRHAMGVVICALALWAFAASAQAQTVIAPPGTQYFLEFDQADTDAPTFTYVLTVDGVRQPGLQASCIDRSTPTAPSFTCQVPFPSITPGPRHLIAVIAAVTVNGTTVESPPSDPIDVQLKAVPGKPGGVRIVVR